MNVGELKAGRELDALVWLALNDHPLDLMNCRYVDGDIQPHAGYPFGHISPAPSSTGPVSMFMLIDDLINNHSVWRFEVSMVIPNSDPVVWEVLVNDSHAVGDTMQEAVAKAAIKVVTDGKLQKER